MLKIAMDLSLESLILVSALAMTANAQELLWSQGGESVNDAFGASVAGAGDVDRDGAADFIVAAPHHGDDADFAGKVYVFSGRTETLLFAFGGDAGQDCIGHAVAGAGDVNGDGVPDVLIGSLGNHAGGHAHGEIQVLSGAGGDLLFTLEGQSPGDWFGRSVSTAGDLDGDGCEEVLVGAPFHAEKGAAYVYSWRKSSMLFSFAGEDASDSFGWSVGRAEDLDGDGVNDLLVGAPNHDGPHPEAGRAYAFSGKTGRLLYVVEGRRAEERLGWSLVAGDDVSGDGVVDLLIGAPFSSTAGTSSGCAYVVSGLSGEILTAIVGSEAGERLGGSVSSAGDVNGDQIADWIAGAEGSRGGTGRAVVISGRHGTPLFELKGRGLEGLGHAVAGVGDLNGDGFGDVLVGAPRNDDNGNRAGAAYVFGGDDLFLQSRRDSVQAGDTLRLDTRGGLSSAPVALFILEIDDSPSWSLLDSGLLDPKGNRTFKGLVPAGLEGTSIKFQAFSVKGSGELAESAVETVTFH